MKAEILTLPVGMLQTNCYLVFDRKKQAVVIDPGDKADKILKQIERLGLQVQAVLLTHAHFDHMLAAPAILQQTGAKLYVPELEASALQSPRTSLLSIVRPPADFSLRADTLLSEGASVQVGEMTFQVWHTPGHTVGSSCYLLEDTLFSGDTVFYHDIGRTDLPGGSMQQMRQSLARILAWPTDLHILPGHGEATTLEQEREYLKVYL